jgi:hypothetical protein
MPRITSSIGEQSSKIIETALQTVLNLDKQKDIRSELETLAIKTNSLISLIYGYTMTEIPSIDTDDEIINWTFPDVGNELCSSIWNLSGGFYKTAASSLRGALEMGGVSLYFQILENEHVGRGYNDKFREWDGGEASTPSWGTTKPKLKQIKNVKDFEHTYGYCLIENAHGYFKYLCSFTHSRSFSPEDGGGTNAMSMKEHIGLFNEDEFRRIAGAMDKTISIIASIWSVAYPHIIFEWGDDTAGSSFCTLEELFCTPQSQDALAFAKALI